MASQVEEVLWQWESSGDWQSTEEIRKAYGNLSHEDAIGLAQRALDSLRSAPSGVGHPQRSWALDVLTRLACLIPGILGDVHSCLLDEHVLTEFPNLHGVLFHGAAPAVRDRLLDGIDGLREGEPPENLLVALAWVADDLVAQKFGEWAAEPPRWAMARRPNDPAGWISYFPTDAGWTIGPAGGRRQLYRSGCRRLIAAGDCRAASVGGPMADASCPWCGNPLTVLLDVAAPQETLGIAGFSGGRLCIPTCEFCVCGPGRHRQPRRGQSLASITALHGPTRAAARIVVAPAQGTLSASGC